MFAVGVPVVFGDLVAFAVLGGLLPFWAVFGGCFTKYQGKEKHGIQAILYTNVISLGFCYKFVILVVISFL